jgi:hypothetical protein
LIEYINKHEGTEWVTMEQVNKEFRQRNAVPQGALTGGRTQAKL